MEIHAGFGQEALYTITGLKHTPNSHYAYVNESIFKMHMCLPDILSTNTRALSELKEESESKMDMHCINPKVASLSCLCLQIRKCLL